MDKKIDARLSWGILPHSRQANSFSKTLVVANEVKQSKPSLCDALNSK